MPDYLILLFLKMFVGFLSRHIVPLWPQRVCRSKLIQLLTKLGEHGVGMYDIYPQELAFGLQTRNYVTFSIVSR